jgi:hypothetical protein
MRAGERLRSVELPRGDGRELRRPFGLFVRVSYTEPATAGQQELVNAANLASLHDQT